MSRRLTLISVLLLSCIKFESPYEDLNGIYLQWIGSYDIQGVKIMFDSDVGYVLLKSLVSYIVDKESVEPDKEYSSTRGILDFDAKDNYAYLVSSSFGLEVVDFQLPRPYLCGELEVPGAKTVRASNGYVYLLDDKSLYVVNISNKQVPEIGGEFEFAVAPSYLAVDSSSAYVLLSNNTFCMLDIRDPGAIAVKSELQGDSTFCINMFAVNGPYVYFLANNKELATYENKNGNLVPISAMCFPQNVTFLSAEKEYAIALSAHTLYLVSLEYPSQPCVSEMINLQSSLRSGTKRGNYIFLLTPDLNIVEVKEIPE